MTRFISYIPNSTIGQKWPQYKGLSPTPLAIKKYIFPINIIRLFKTRRMG
jgi:hypothetical protein